MSDQLPTSNLPAVTMPELQGAMAKPSRGSLSSEMEFSSAGMLIKSVEQGMQLAKYLVAGGAAPKGWTDAQVFLAMQAGLENGLGHTGGIMAFVIINNMPSWRGQAAVGKIRASRALEPGTLDFGCDADPDKEGHLRGWARARRVGDRQDTWRFFTQTEAMEAGLWSSGNNWTKFKRRMLMWRAVGFLTKDLFSDVLGNFPIAEELLFRGTPEDDIDRIPARLVSQLTGAVDAPASDSLLDELAPRSETVSAPEPQIDVPPLTGLSAKDLASDALAYDIAEEEAGKEPTEEQVADVKAENRFANLLASMESEPSEFRELESWYYKALTAAGKSKPWIAEAEALFKKMQKRFPRPKE